MIRLFGREEIRACASFKLLQCCSSSSSPPPRSRRTRCSPTPGSPSTRCCAKTSSPASWTTTWTAWQGGAEHRDAAEERPGEKANLLAWKAGAAHVARRARARGRQGRRVRAASSGARAKTLPPPRSSRPARTASPPSPAARYPSSPTGCPSSIVPPPGRRPTTLLACCGSSRAPASIRCRSTSRGGARRADPVGAAHRPHRRSREVSRQDADVLANTPYEEMAKQWKADPASAATTSLTCKNCHNPGRLANRIAALDK